MILEIGSILKSVLTKLEESAPMYSEINLQLCTTKKAGCTLCSEICPVDAISHEPDTSIDLSKCIECGICGPACPNEAISLSFYSDKATNNQIIRASIKEDSRLTIGCNGVKGLYLDVPQETGDESLVVPCLGCVHETTVLLSKLSPLKNIHITPCNEKCSNVKGRESWGKIQKRFDILGDALNLHSSEGFVNELRAESNRVNSRRGFLNVVGRSLQSTLFQASVGRFMAKNETTNVSVNTNYRREILVELSSKLGINPKEVTGTDMQIGAPEIDEKCTVCGICAHFCPTRALGKTQTADYEEIDISPALCTGCGVCVHVCPEKAIGLCETVNLGEFSIKRKKLLRKKLMTCTECKTKFLDDGESVMCQSCQKRLTI